MTDGTPRAELIEAVDEARQGYPDDSTAGGNDPDHSDRLEGEHPLFVAVEALRKALADDGVPEPAWLHAWKRLKAASKRSDEDKLQSCSSRFSELFVAWRDGRDADAEPAEDDRGARAPRLNDCEQAIVQALTESGPLKGDKLASAAGYPFNANFKATLAAMVRHGIIRNDRDGYGLVGQDMGQD